MLTAHLMVLWLLMEETLNRQTQMFGFDQRVSLTFIHLIQLRVPVTQPLRFTSEQLCEHMHTPAVGAALHFLT